MNNDLNSTVNLDTNLGHIGSVLLGSAKETSLKEYVSVISSTGLNRVWTQLKLMSKGKGWISENSIHKVNNGETLSRAIVGINGVIKTLTEAKEQNRTNLGAKTIEAAHKSRIQVPEALQKLESQLLEDKQKGIATPSLDNIDVNALVREAKGQIKLIQHLEKVNIQISKQCTVTLLKEFLKTERKTIEDVFIELPVDELVSFITSEAISKSNLNIIREEFIKWSSPDSQAQNKLRSQYPGTKLFIDKDNAADFKKFLYSQKINVITQTIFELRSSSLGLNPSDFANIEAVAKKNENLNTQKDKILAFYSGGNKDDIKYKETINELLKNYHRAYSNFLDTYKTASTEVNKDTREFEQLTCSNLEPVLTATEQKIVEADENLKNLKNELIQMRTNDNMDFHVAFSRYMNEYRDSIIALRMSKISSFDVNKIPAEESSPYASTEAPFSIFNLLSAPEQASSIIKLKVDEGDIRERGLKKIEEAYKIYVKSTLSKLKNELSVDKSKSDAKTSDPESVKPDKVREPLRKDIDAPLNPRERERLTDLKKIDKSEWKFNKPLYEDYLTYISRVTNTEPTKVSFDPAQFDEAYNIYLTDLARRMQTSSLDKDNDPDEAFTELNRLIDLNTKLVTISKSKLDDISKKLNNIDKAEWDSNKSLSADYLAFLSKATLRNYTQNPQMAPKFKTFYTDNRALYDRYIKDLAQRIATDTITEELRTAFNTLIST